ncbi:hypothetical protein Tco_0859106 [Tanacetum coccineum]|uniref:Uncharacterized protein n=1 Tax=Tanacetum coccineum TaxID=301880 RepID=A0ABQ5BCU5_9ASTR
MTSKAQQSAMDNALVAQENLHAIGKCNMRINPGMKPKEPTYQVNKASYRFKIDNKRFSVNVEVFRDILNICPRVPAQEFDEPLTEEEALSFIYELGHSGEIKYITDVIVDHMHQPWRTFASIINKCLCGKIDNKDTKKQDKMLYPRFTKIIIHHFLEKDKSISMRNRTFMHIAQDDSLLGTMRFISRHEDTQVYGAILPKSMTNQAILDYVAYKTYYAIASGAKPPKSKKPKTKSDSAISSKETPCKKKPTKAKKDVPSKKKPTSKPKPTKKKAPVKADRGKGDGIDFESEVPDEQQRKTSGADEGTGTKPGVPDVPKYDSKSDEESWGDSGKEDDDDEDDTEDDEGNDDGDDSDGNDDDVDDDDENDSNDFDDSDQERIESDRDEVPNLNQFNEEHKEEEEENVDEFTDKEDDEENEEESDDGEELYKDVNVNLRQEDVEMIDADQGGADQYNVSQESGFEQEEEDTHVTLTTVHDTQKTKGPMQSSFVLSDLKEKLLNFKNVSPADNEIASLMDSTEYIDLIDSSVRTVIRKEVNTQLPQILPKAVSDFATPVIEQNVTESLEAAVLARSSSQQKSTYEAAASLSDYELTKILLDKMEKRKSHLRAEYKRKLYDALVESYNTNKDLFNTYGEVFTLKRSRDDKDKDQDPSAGSDRGTKRRKSSKEAESQKDPRQHVDFRPPQTWISITARDEKPHTSFDELTDTPIDFFTFVINRVNIANLTQELLARLAFNLLKGTYKSIMKLEYHFEEYHRGRQVIPQDYFINKDLEYLKGESLSRYSTSVTNLWIKDMVPNLWSPVKVVYDKHAYWVTRLKIMKRYDYGYLDEIEVRREDQQLYTFKEGEEIVSVFKSGPIVSAFPVVYAYCRSCGQFPMKSEGAVDGRGITSNHQGDPHRDQRELATPSIYQQSQSSKEESKKSSSMGILRSLSDMSNRFLVVVGTTPAHFSMQGRPSRRIKVFSSAKLSML